MNLFLQFGYGMMKLCRDLAETWDDVTVILSPRDLEPEQIERFSSQLADQGSTLLIDPQFYLPTANHHRLISHAYWPQNYDAQTFWQVKNVKALIEELFNINTRAGSTAFILPGIYTEQVDDTWIANLRTTLEVSRDLAVDKYITVALGANVLANVEQVHQILSFFEGVKPNLKGIYLVCEHPQGTYLVDNPSWVANVLDLIAGYRLLGFEVILGYSNHQMLIASVAGVNGIASGTWMNVRSFPLEKFRADYEEETRQRSTWYYAPTVLSEYKISFLDTAHELGLLNLLAPPDEMRNEYSNQLFSGVRPSTANFTEVHAFRHYLDCLRAQCLNAEYDTFDDAVQQQRDLLRVAHERLNILHRSSIRGVPRDFFEIVDVNMAALNVFEKRRAAILRREWNNLSN